MCASRADLVSIAVAADSAPFVNKRLAKSKRPSAAGIPAMVLSALFVAPTNKNVKDKALLSLFGLSPQATKDVNESFFFLGVCAMGLLTMNDSLWRQ